ncbi:MAG TPA: DUF3810 family protein, partial [Candidatus Cybelea sp.]
MESAYSNGAYPVWERIAYSITHRLPWSLGDLAALAGIVAIVWQIVAFARLRRKRWRDAGALLLGCAAVLGLYAVWFELSWGWNYARAPLEARVRFDAARITPAAAAVLRRRAMAEMNALAPAAHARAKLPLDRETLRAAWLPAVQRSGDTWAPHVGPAK